MDALLEHQIIRLRCAILSSKLFLNEKVKTSKGLKKDLNKLFKLYYFMWTKLLSNKECIFLTDSIRYSLSTDAKWAANLFCGYTLIQAQQVLDELNCLASLNTLDIGQRLKAFTKAQNVLEDLDYFYSAEGEKFIAYFKDELHEVIKNYSSHYGFKDAINSKINWLPLKQEINRRLVTDIPQNILKHEMGRNCSLDVLNIMQDGIKNYYLSGFYSSPTSSYSQYCESRVLINDSLNVLLGVPLDVAQTRLNTFNCRGKVRCSLKEDVLVKYGLIKSLESLHHFLGGSFKGRVTDALMFSQGVYFSVYKKDKIPA